MVFSTKVYDILKWVVQIVLPALATLYAALGALWGFPYVEQVVGTISAITVFLGACMRISSSSYEGEGQLVVNSDSDDDSQYQLVLNKDLSELANEKSFVIKVNTDSTTAASE